MLSFKYVARDPATGQKVKAEVQAESEQAASKLIRKEGLAPISIEAAGGGESPLGKILHKIRTKDKVLFSRQLSTLINAGLPLVQSLRNVAGQTTNKRFQVVINKLITDVEAGSSLSESMRRYPEAFDEVFVSLVAAGEVSGTLDRSLDRIANQQEKDAEIMAKVRGAMVYPAVVLLVMGGVVGFMVVKVLPQVEVIYQGLDGVSLPLVTRVLLAVSHFITRFWYIVIIMFVVGFFGGTRWIRTLGGRRIIDRAKMRAWPIGGLFMKMYMARFTRTGATLIGSGVPLLQMLEIVSKAVNNVHIEDSLKKAIEKVKGGKALSDSIDGDSNFLDLVPNMLRIGEQSGAIEQMMGKTADYYEREVDNEVKAISTIIEPVLMIVLGVVALTIVAAILMPIYGLVGKSGFGG